MKPRGKQCVVCRRLGAAPVTLEGGAVVEMCGECAGDTFRVREAKRIAGGQ